MRFEVLIVDDQIDSTSALTAMLERRGFTCHHAVNLAEAKVKLEAILPHLLVVDVNLGPTENGLAWLDEVRKGPYAFIPAIVLTSSSEEKNVGNSLRLGVDDYIIKPSSPQVLAKKITDLMTRLQTNVSYALDENDDTMLVVATLPLQISAISETGFCISSHIANREPITFNKPLSDLFDDIGAAALKKITFLNYEKTGGRSLFPVRNYCQAIGWSEPDFKRIRLWIRRNQLGRNF